MIEIPKCKHAVESGASFVITTQPVFTCCFCEMDRLRKLNDDWAETAREQLAEADAARALTNIANECRASAERECERLRGMLKEAIRMAHPSTSGSFTDDYRRDECERLTKAVAL